MQRERAELAEVEQAISDICAGLNKRIKKHGMDKLVSVHESLGLLTEEYKECIDAAHANQLDEYLEEMIDMAVVAIWTRLSLKK